MLSFGHTAHSKGQFNVLVTQVVTIRLANSQLDGLIQHLVSSYKHSDVFHRWSSVSIYPLDIAAVVILKEIHHVGVTMF